MKGTLPQKVCQSVDGSLNAPAAREGASKQTQPETNRRVGKSATAIGLVAISSVSSLFLHQKSDRAIAAEPVVKAPAIGIELDSASTEMPTLSDASASEGIYSVTWWFSSAGDHSMTWSPEKYWSLGWGQQQFQEKSVEVTASQGDSPSSVVSPSGLVATSSAGSQDMGDRILPRALSGDNRETSVFAQELPANVPELIPEMTSVHPVYVDGLRADIQGLQEKYHEELSRDRPDRETPRVVPIALGSEQMREAPPSVTRNRHRVMPGETLTEISRQYDVSISELMHANQLTDGDQIKVNQLLTIPAKRPATSVGLARADFNNAPGTVEHNRFINGLLLELKRAQQNQATSRDNSRVNNGPRQPEPSPPPTAPLTRRETTRENTNKPETVAVAPMWRNIYDPLMPFERTVSPQLPPLQAPDRYLPEGTPPFNGYIWPAKGTLTSGYGWRWGRMHRGIDIAGPIGTPILSAGPGVVDFAGWNRGGYGKLVEIRHPDGSLTRYAHNNRILVNKGQQVKQGQQIAEMGSTGYSTGPHLHFEIHPSGKGADNPISYLPPRK